MANLCHYCHKPIAQSQWMRKQLSEGNVDVRKYHMKHCQECNKDGKGKGGDCNRCSEGLNELSNMLNFGGFS